MVVFEKAVIASNLVVYYNDCLFSKNDKQKNEMEKQKEKDNIPDEWTYIYHLP